MPAPRIPLPAELSSRPFTRREAIAYGIPFDVLRGPSVQTIDRGIFLGADLELTLTRRLAGYLLVLPRDTVVDSVTALQLNGIDVGSATPYRFRTTAAHHPRRRTIRVRRVARLPENRSRVSRLVPALVAARTELSLLDLVTAGDWLPFRAERRLRPEVTVRQERPVDASHDVSRSAHGLLADPHRQVAGRGQLLVASEILVILPGVGAVVVAFVLDNDRPGPQVGSAFESPQ